MVTYNWEEFDLGPAGAGSFDNGSSPIFRPWPSTTSPSRTFPRMANVLAGTVMYGETVPTTTRTMTFRCTIRDNYAGAGAVDWDATTVSVVSTAGPFTVAGPNGGETWEALRPAPVTWNVAGTNLSPISTPTVDILVSSDGGANFTGLATGVPNDGAETVTAPALQTSQARVMVRGGGNIFFDVSNANFNIIGRPIAASDTAVTPVGVPLAIPVLANDLDPNGQTLSITSVQSPAVGGGTATVDDNGTPGNTGDDRILYTPPAGMSGSDLFDYVISDGTYADTATVFVDIQRTTAVGQPSAPRLVSLGIHPNPVHDAMQIDFQLPRPAAVDLAVFTVQGRRVATVTSGRLSGEAHSLRWEGRSVDGTRLPSGVYMMRLRVDGTTIARRFVLMR